MGCFANDEFVVFDCTVHNRIVGSQNETETDFKLVWYLTLYCVSPGAVGDTTAGIRWQALSHQLFEQREIT